LGICFAGYRYYAQIPYNLEVRWAGDQFVSWSDYENKWTPLGNEKPLTLKTFRNGWKHYKTDEFISEEEANKLRDESLVLRWQKIEENRYRVFVQWYAFNVWSFWADEELTEYLCQPKQFNWTSSNPLPAKPPSQSKNLVELSNSAGMQIDMLKRGLE
jgi:hypothetical protein